MYILHCREYRVQCTVYRVQSTAYRVQRTAYRVQCTMYSVQSTVYRVKCTEYSVQFTAYRVQRTECSVQCTGINSEAGLSTVGFTSAGFSQAPSSLQLGEGDFINVLLNILQTWKNKLHKLHGVHLFFGFSAKLVHFSTNFGSLNVQIKNN